MFRLNPRIRIQQYVDNLSRRVTFSDKRSESRFIRVRNKFKTISKRLRIYQISHIITGALLYVSVASALAANISTTIAQVLTPFVAIANIIGIGVLSAAYFTLGAITRALMTDMLIEYTQMVAIVAQQQVSEE